jgi:hypothetical protein
MLGERDRTARKKNKTLKITLSLIYAILNSPSNSSTLKFTFGKALK